MKVVAVDRIKAAQQRYPSAHNHLQGWYHIVSQGDFKSEMDLRTTFGDVRGFNHEFKFPVPETTLLIHTVINFESQVALIEEIRPGSH